VKLQIAMGAQSMEQDMTVRALGTVVDPSGIVLIPGAAVGIDSGATLVAIKHFLPEGVHLTMKPSDVKVVVGGDGRERDAILVAKDGNLGIAFVRLLEDPAEPLEALDVREGADPRIGAPLLAVGRKTEGYDYVPLLLRLYASRTIEKPRKMWGIEGEYEAAGLGSAEMEYMSMGAFVGGTPAYHPTGEVAGILSSQTVVGDSPRDIDSADVLLPLSVVAKSLEQARKLVPEALQKAREGK